MPSNTTPDTASTTVGDAEGNIAAARAVWEPLARGESQDLQPFFDSLADDVRLSTTAGDLLGRDAVIRYLTAPSPDLAYNPFETPLEYFGAGDKVVIVGDETFTQPSTDDTHHAPWAWVINMPQGRVTSILAIQDLGAIADLVGAKLQAAQQAP